MERDPYHHGDLRTALLDAAEDALRADPDAALSVRALAGRIGVSATAPHAHFRTRSDLLAALAARGYERLRQTLLRAPDTAPDAEGRMRALAEQYLDFGASNPGLYRLMFTTGVGLETNPELRQSSRASYDVLRDGVRRAFPGRMEAETNRIALTAWALVHGFGSLLTEHRIAADIAPDRSPSALARLAAATLVKAEEAE